MTTRDTDPEVSDQGTATEARGDGLRGRLYRLRERVRARPLLNTAWRACVFAIGWLVVLAGVFMLVFPGPGWVTIFIGFAILATEFTWARRALRKAKSIAMRVSARALDPRVRRRNQIITVVVVILVILGCAMYVRLYGLPFVLPGRVL